MINGKAIDLMSGISDITDEKTFYNTEEIDCGKYGTLRILKLDKVYFVATDIANIRSTLERDRMSYITNTFKRKFRVYTRQGKYPTKRELNFIEEIDIYIMYTSVSDESFKTFLMNIVEQIILPYHDDMDLRYWICLMERNVEGLVNQAWFRKINYSDYKEWTESVIAPQINYIAAKDGKKYKDSKAVLSAAYRALNEIGYDISGSIQNYKEQRKTMYLEYGYSKSDYENEIRKLSALKYVYINPKLREALQFQIEKMATKYGYTTNIEGGKSDELVTD